MTTLFGDTVTDEKAQLEFWRRIAFAACGMVITLGICVFKDEQNFATKADIEKVEVLQREANHQIIQTQSEQGHSIGELNYRVGRISEHLGIADYHGAGGGN